MKRNRFKLFLLVAGIFLASSCKNNTLPTIIQKTDGFTNSRQILAPQNIRAIGGKRCITLEWTESANATNYSVYAANTQFDEFVKIGDTSENTFTYTAVPGITRYFKLVAENDYLSIHSDDSQIVKGYTIATPVITSIESETTEDGNRTIVSWYMENVEDYQNEVRYEIICHDDIPQEKQVNGAETDQTYCIFENLPQNKNIEFEVQAYFQNAQSEIESSGKMNTLTSAMQIPRTVENFTATEGTSINEIELSFTLPETSFIKSGEDENSYDQKPLYFKLYRRLVDKNNSDKAWTNEDLIVEHLYFNGQVKKTIKNPEGIELTEDEEQDLFNTYSQGTVVTYKDTNLLSGKKYEYKIQSYVDNYDKVITSNKSSVSTATGWTCGYPSLRTKDFEYEYKTYTDTSVDPAVEKKIKMSATLDFKASWENFGNEDKYKFIIETTKTSIDDKNEKTTSYKLFNSADDINAYEKTFSLATYDEATDTYTVLDEDEGYYTFSFYVVHAADAEESADAITKAITSIKVPGTILVTPQMVIPEIKNLTFEDGYTNHVDFKWKKQADTAYSLDRYTIDENNNAIEDTPFDTVTAGWTEDGDFLTYSDTTAESGKRYVYTLSASNGSLNVPSEPLTAETLGTPEPSFDVYFAKHNSITIKWKKVLQADKYSVSLKDAANNDLLNDLPEYCDIPEEPDADGYYTCIITEPKGFDDAIKSGKNWTAVVTATSLKTDNEGNKTTEDKDTANSENITVRTLGPASLSTDENFDASVSKSTTEITVTWSPIPGAKGYVIKRTRYNVKNTEALSDADVYVIAENPKGTGEDDVKKDGENVAITIATAKASDGKITFTDKYTENTKTVDEATTWDKNQDKLAWGFPYHYTILPLENIEEEFDGETKLGSIAYDNIDDAAITEVGSCRGYGHNVRATKAEDPYEITITWDNPYGIENPKNAKLFSKSDDSEWTLYGGTTISDNGGGNYSFTVEPKGDERTKPHYFAIGYETKVPLKNYLDDATEKKDVEYSSTESLNKGYTYSLELTASPVLENNTLTLKEDFSWTLWDYEKRAIGPDKDKKIELCLFNNDFVVVTDKDDGWRTIASFDKDGNVTPYNETENPKYNVAFVEGETKTTSVQIKPKTLKDVDHPWYNGLLKVQRDYKHYAKLKCDRINKNGETVKLSWADKGKSKDDDLLVYGYRNFTDGEVARMASLIYSYGFYLHDSAGDKQLTKVVQYPYAGDLTVNGPDGGTAVFDKGYSDGTTINLISPEVGKYLLNYSFTNFTYEILTPGNNYATMPLKITVPRQEKMRFIKGKSDWYIYRYGSFTMTVNGFGEYAGVLDATVAFKYDAGTSNEEKKTFSIAITRNGKTTNLYSPGQVSLSADSPHVGIMSWCPIQIHPNKQYHFKDFACDWWGE